MQFAAALLIIAVAMVLLIRGAEVRLTLFAAGLALATLALTPLAVFDVFLAEMGNGKTIGPICSAMGYAFVLKATGCDRELVQLLLAPARRAWWLLIPGGCVTGFVMNIAITSQTACAAAVAPILVPLMRAAGFPGAIAGATLVLGCSGGGSLYNPGDADLVAIQESSRAPMQAAMGAMFWPLLGGFATATALFAITTRREAAEVTAADVVSEETRTAGARWKALLPPLPVILIFVFLPGVVWSTPPAPFEHGLPVLHAMLAATLVVLVLCRREAMAGAKAFFEGMGYAYANIISLVVTASCFIAGMTAVGLTARLVQLVSGAGLGAKLAAGFFPGLLGVVSGSGIGPSVAFSKAVLPALRGANLAAALDLGTLGAIAATFGRSMSPAAAVVIFSAAQAGVPVRAVVKRTAPVLLVGYVVTWLIVVARA
jgi:DcuC family C4-dicarboxylate transporter